MDVNTRDARRPDADEMMALRIILLLITFGSTLKDILEVRTFRLRVGLFGGICNIFDEVFLSYFKFIFKFKSIVSFLNLSKISHMSKFGGV